ncbi:GFA family protein [Shimia sp. Alg240-R146]|uniref:GFA family protein n=1 Tax=Shimia sp. Alg240-R146 TaxID=2993449 RepID=UPI0022E085E3|nr:GFA family protein [Shimia sp. Alg240-R146]
MVTRNGHCMCGAVNFTATGVSSEFGACYCDMCRRWNGDRFVGVHVPFGAMQIDGADQITTHKSSDWAERSFCKNCGSNLWYRLTDGPDAGNYSVALGLIDDVTGMTLAREFFVDRKDCLFDLPEGRIQMTTADIHAKYGLSEEASK